MNSPQKVVNWHHNLPDTQNQKLSQKRQTFKQKNLMLSDQCINSQLNHDIRTLQQQIYVPNSQIKTPKNTIQTSIQDKQSEQKFKNIYSDMDSYLSESQFQSEESQEESVVQQKQNVHVNFSKEIQELSDQFYEQQIRVWNLLNPFLTKISEIVNQYYGYTQYFGSFATRLWIPQSDIDILLIFQNKNLDKKFQNLIQIIKRKIIQLNCHFSIKVIDTYKLPMIKIILCQKYEFYQVQLLFSQKKNIGSKYVHFINKTISQCPQIAIIYAAIRYFLKQKNLHDHRQGGLKAYALFLMIYTLRANYSYEYISQYIQHFSYYYGISHQYQIQKDFKGQFIQRINILDPLNRQNNMGGKNTNIKLLKDCLKTIYYSINIDSSGKKMSYIAECINLI